ncbi:class I SAM-dependent RNA methyltransferase [Demequina activiva]|uniref:23S rRNA methyltransferase n=1 Tax=Demequina activiva TaxID=1582364 RepID=A0A919Q3R6_9MICO|nr:TRAM domain-containing protein [Demequina activiva]GIG54677.1 23S rRNA methyltransferase [Demequina activiva]
MTEPDLVRLEVGAPAHGGHCVARHDGRVVFVRHALPGEVVEARLTEHAADASFWRADAVAVLEASPDRVESPWPQAGAGGAGGGELGHVALPAQRAWKLAVLREAFERFAHQEFPGAVHAAPGDDDRGGLAYRTRVSAVADAEGRAAMHGFRAPDLHVLSAMPLAVPEVEEALLGRRFPAGARVTVVAPSDSELRVLIDGQPSRGGKVDSRPNAPRAVREVVHVGDRSWHYRLDASAFWQVHREAPAVLVREVLDRIGEAGRVMDLYAGAGLFTLALADGGCEVLSVEADARGAGAARRNVHDHPTVTVVEGDVRRTLEEGAGPADAVVLDPPRSGAGRRTVEALTAVDAQRLVYVACDPVALARDTALLSERGYALVEAEAFDLFPMTHHVETVATFQRR